MRCGAMWFHVLVDWWPTLIDDQFSIFDLLDSHRGLAAISVATVVFDHVSHRDPALQLFHCDLSIRAKESAKLHSTISAALKRVAIESSPRLAWSQAGKSAADLSAFVEAEEPTSQD